MANLIETTDTTKIKPLEGACVRRFNAGAAVTAGWPVYLDSSGNIRKARVGGGDKPGARGCADDTGERRPWRRGGQGAGVCLDGNATPGNKLLTMNSAGGMDHTGGTYKTVVGVAESSTVLFVRPRMSDVA